MGSGGVDALARSLHDTAGGNRSARSSAGAAREHGGARNQPDVVPVREQRGFDSAPVAPPYGRGLC